MTAGFRQVSYNDLAAMASAISPATVAIMIEGIQGEGGVTPATPDYLSGLRRLCDEKKLLLFMDGVQCGHFRTGRFQSFQRILENVSANSGTLCEDNFLPDGISMAKSLGGGFPIGAFWVRAPYADLLSAGTHGTTFGGSPLACTVALKISGQCADSWGCPQERLAGSSGEISRSHSSGAGVGINGGDRANRKYRQSSRRNQQDAGGAIRQPSACCRPAEHPGWHTDPTPAAATEFESERSRRRLKNI